MVFKYDKKPHTHITRVNSFISLELVGCSCVATAYNNTHVNYPQKISRFFIDCIRSPYNIFLFG
jgi:hypothetical protein